MISCISRFGAKEESFAVSESEISFLITRYLSAQYHIYHWGIVHGIDAQGQLKVERADGKIFLFDLSTGKTTEA